MSHLSENGEAHSITSIRDGKVLNLTDKSEFIEVNCETAVAKSVEFADKSPFPDPEALTEDVYTSYKN